MKREELIDIVRDEPLFSTGILLSPGVDLHDVRKQLSRWSRDGTVLQLRRGLYALGDTYRRQDPHPYEVSNELVPGSYVSLETVLAHRGIIPEAVFVTTAVTTGRQGTRKTPFGTFVYQHIKESLFWGYEAIEVAPDRMAFAATPEKALLDLAYLRPRSDTPAFVRELRLQRLDELDLERLRADAERFASPKVRRFAAIVTDLAAVERTEYNQGEGEGA
jgi:predicted transcriptional regulator of viral defense system